MLEQRAVDVRVIPLPPGTQVHSFILSLNLRIMLDGLDCACLRRGGNEGEYR